MHPNQAFGTLTVRRRRGARRKAAAAGASDESEKLMRVGVVGKG